jgi:alpha-L-fucosidase
VHYLARAAGMNANLLLNVGPMPNGKIQPEVIERLRQVGAWLNQHGQSVYGTRGGPVPPRSWGATTQKGNIVYVHLFDWEEGQMALPALGGKVRAVKALKTGKPVLHKSLEGGGLLVDLPAAARDPLSTVLAVELEGPPAVR